MAPNSRIDELRKRLEKEPGSRFFAQLAEELRKEGELEEAIRICREGLGKHPNYPSARMTLGRALFDTGDLAEAQTEFDAVFKAAPDNILASRLLGECYEGLGDLDRATAQYNLTLRLAPGDKQVTARLEAVEARRSEVTGPIPIPAHAALAPPPPAPLRSAAGRPEPPPIPLVAADEEFELERPYEAPRPPSVAPAAVAPPMAPRPEPATVIVPPPVPPRAAAPAVSTTVQETLEPLPLDEVEAVETLPPAAFRAPSVSPMPPPPIVAPRPPAAAVPPPVPPPVRTATPAPPPPPPRAAEPVIEPIEEATARYTVLDEEAPAAIPEPQPRPSVLEPPVPTMVAPGDSSGARRAGLETLFRFSALEDLDGAPAAPAAPAVVPLAPPPLAPPARSPGLSAPPPAPPPVFAPPAPPVARVPEPPSIATPEIVSPTLAELYFSQGHVDKAIEVYRKLLRGGLENEKARTRLLELEEMQGRAQAAMAAPAAGPSAAFREDRRAVIQRQIDRLEQLLTVLRTE